MNNLKSTIADLAESFASAVLAALRTASLDEILEHTNSGGSSRGRSGASSRGSDGRRVRRSANDIASMVDAIEALLAKNPAGLRAEQIRKELNVQAKELPRPLADGVSEKRFSKEGQKRATTYFAKGGAGSGRRAAPGRRGAKKR